MLVRNNFYFIFNATKHIGVCQTVPDFATFFSLSPGTENGKCLLMLENYSTLKNFWNR